MKGGRKLVREWGLPAALIGAAVALLYGNTLEVPFYLDDNRALLENYRLRDLGATMTGLFKQRGLTNLTFALNYRLSGWALPPLHLVNIALHAGCGLLAWRLLLRLLPARRLALPGALLFVSHPVQTQAVNYLVQRATLLGAFLWMLAFLLYLRARDVAAAGQRPGTPVFFRPYLGAVAAGALAVLAKENTATLPLVLLVWERLFPAEAEPGWRPALRRVLPFCVAPLLLGAGTALSLAGGNVERIFYYPLASLQHNTPLNYLVTQFSVLWVYLRLLMLPYGQALEHGYPVVTELLTLRSAAALIGLLGLGWLAWRVRRSRPLMTLGAVWFFLALAVESSVIPLDPLFEHRLYLPLFGVLLVALDGMVAILQEKKVLVATLVLLLVWSPLAWRRNALWCNPIAFYEDNVRVAPDSERAVKRLAFLYQRDGRYGEGLRLLEAAVERLPEGYFLYNDLARLYALLNREEQALALLERGVAQAPRHAALYEAAAFIRRQAGDMPSAIAWLQRGLQAENPDRSRLLNSLGVYYSEAGASHEAESAFLASLENPTDAAARAATYLNLAREYYFRGSWEQVRDTLLKVLELSPGHPLALERLGEVALKLGDRKLALRVADKLRHVDPEIYGHLRLAMLSAGWLP